MSAPFDLVSLYNDLPMKLVRGYLIIKDGVQIERALLCSSDATIHTVIN